MDGYPGVITFFAWSPDSTQLVAAVSDNYGFDIYVAHLNDNQPHPITVSRGTQTNNRYPFWLSDSKRIILISYPKDGNADGIYIVEADGSNIRRVCAG